MAWRIHDSVKRGEIDNRERGLVRGKIWLDGLVEPVVLDLQGKITVGGGDELCNLTKRITDLLSITKLLTVFETFESESDAVRSFAASVKV